MERGAACVGDILDAQSATYHGRGVTHAMAVTNPSDRSPLENGLSVYTLCRSIENVDAHS